MKARAKHKSMSTREREVLALITRSPDGISRVDIADEIGLSFERVRDVTHALRRRGLAAPSWHGRCAVWATMYRAAEIRAETPAQRRLQRLIDSGDPVRAHRPAGTWECRQIPSLLRPADVFDGLTP